MFMLLPFLSFLILYLFIYSTASVTMQYTIDQAGSTPAAFPYTDLHRWGVRQVVAGSLDCSSYLNAIPGGPWYDESGLAQVAKEIETNKAAILAAHTDGMQIFLSSDLFQFPTLLLKKYKENLTWPGSKCFGYTLGPTCIDIRANTTRVFLRLLFDEMINIVNVFDETPSLCKLTSHFYKEMLNIVNLFDETRSLCKPIFTKEKLNIVNLFHETLSLL